MSANAPGAAEKRTFREVAFVPILLQKSAMKACGWREFLELGAYHPLAGMGLSTPPRPISHPLCKARFCYRRWSYDKLCEPAEVLRDCRQCELELGTTWPAQAQTTEPEDPLEMCKQHLDSFAIAARRSNARS